MAAECHATGAKAQDSLRRQFDRAIVFEQSFVKVEGMLSFPLPLPFPLAFHAFAASRTFRIVPAPSPAPQAVAMVAMVVLMVAVPGPWVVPAAQAPLVVHWFRSAVVWCCRSNLERELEIMKESYIKCRPWACHLLSSTRLCLLRKVRKRTSMTWKPPVCHFCDMDQMKSPNCIKIASFIHQQWNVAKHTPGLYLFGGLCCNDPW